MTLEFSIGALARETGCKIPTIRWYEQIGLLPEASRTAGNQRRYNRRHAERLTFIRHCRELGFPLEAVHDLLGLAASPGQSCEAADRLARRHLREVDRKIAGLQKLRSELSRIVDRCEGGRVADCGVMESLADHSKCLSKRH